MGVDVQRGEHRNGKKWARVALVSRGVTGKVEGVGDDDASALEDLVYCLLQLAFEAETASQTVATKQLVEPLESL